MVDEAVAVDCCTGEFMNLGADRGTVERVALYRLRSDRVSEKDS